MLFNAVYGTPSMLKIWPSEFSTVKILYKINFQYLGSYYVQASKLAEIMNFTIKYIREPTSGRQLENGSWTGTIGRLEKKEADIGMRMGLSLERSFAADFTVQLGTNPLSIIMQKPQGQFLNNWAYTKVFRFDSWITFFSISLLLGFGLSLGMSDTFTAQTQSHEQMDLLEAIGYVGMGWIQRENYIPKRLLSVKVLSFTIIMFGWACFSSYSATLTSAFTVLDKPIEIKTFGDLLRHGFNTMTTNGSIYENLVREAQPGSELYEVYEHDMRLNPRAFMDNDNILKEIQKNPRSAMFAPEYFTQRGENLVAVHLPDSFVSYEAFGLQKDSEFTKVMNYYIIKLLETSFILRSSKDLTETKFQENGEDAALQLGYNHVLFPVLLLVFGTTVAIALVFLENFVKFGAQILRKS